MPILNIHIKTSEHLRVDQLVYECLGYRTEIMLRWRTPMNCPIAEI